MSDRTDDFQSIISRARSGDPEAVSELVERYEPDVRMVARMRLGAALRPYLDSVDLVQSVHRSVLMGLRQDKYAFESPENLVALALTIVRRKVARHWRKLKRQQRLDFQYSDKSGLSELLSSLNDRHADPSQDAEVQDQIQTMCESLSEIERKLIMLRLEGHSTVEVARKLEVDPDVLRVRLSRLRRRLRESGLFTDWM